MKTSTETPEIYDYPKLPYSHRNDINIPPTIEGYFWRRSEHWGNITLVLIAMPRLPYYAENLMVFAPGESPYLLENDGDIYWAGPVVLEPPKVS